MNVASSTHLLWMDIDLFPVFSFQEWCLCELAYSVFLGSMCKSFPSSQIHVTLLACGVGLRFSPFMENDVVLL